MTILITVVLCLAGFVLIVKQAVPESLNPPYRTAVLLLLAFVYACFVGGLAVIAYLYGDPGLVLYMLFILFALAEIWSLSTTVLRFRHTFRQKYVLLFFLYVFVILLITLFSREPRTTTVLQTELFSAVKDALATGSMEELNHMILNVVLFLPLGYLFVQIEPQRLDRFYHVLGIGALLSTLIESCQLVFRLGNCDVDDILANTIGALLGLVVFRVVRRFNR